MSLRSRRAKHADGLNLINANEARVGTNSELANLSAILSPQSHKLRELLSAGRRASNDGDSQRAISLYEAAYFRAAAVSDRTTAADALFRAARHARRIAEPAVSLEFVGLILNLTDKRTPEVALKGHLALGHHLINAGRDAEVMAVLREAESLFAMSSIVDLCEFLELHACAAAMQGRTTAAVSSFDVLLDLSKRNETVEEQVSRLCTGAGNAMTQGLTSRARVLHQRSVGIARRHGLGFSLSFSMMAQAWTCLCSGDLGEARILHEAADIWPTSNLYVRFYRSAVGVLLGALSHDYDLIERCLDIGALELAFKSEAPQRIGPIAAAVHERHLVHGHVGKAADLLTRSLQAIDNPDDCWWLLLQAAKSGTREDVARGLLVLADYANDFPLAYAHRLLLRARSAQLEGRLETSVNFRKRRSRRFLQARMALPSGRSPGACRALRRGSTRF